MNREVERLRREMIEQYPELHGKLNRYDAAKAKDIVDAEVFLLRRLLYAPDIMIRAGTYDTVLREVHETFVDVHHHVLEEMATMRQAINLILKSFVSIELDSAQQIPINPDMTEKIDRAMHLVEESKKLLAMLGESELSTPMRERTERELEDRGESGEI